MTLESKDPCYFVLGQGSGLAPKLVSPGPDNKSEGNWGCCGEYENMFVNCSESRVRACICRSGAGSHFVSALNSGWADPTSNPNKFNNPINQNLSQYACEKL